MGKLDGKIALITGGNKGIGKGIARGLADEGATLVLAARGVEELDQTAEELRESGATVVTVPTDVTDEAQIEAMFERTMETFNRLDIWSIIRERLMGDRLTSYRRKHWIMCFLSISVRLFCVRVQRCGL